MILLSTFIPSEDEPYAALIGLRWGQSRRYGNKNRQH